MGRHAVILICHDNLHFIGGDRDFGTEVYHFANTMWGLKPNKRKWLFLGECSSNDSLPVCYAKGAIWSRSYNSRSPSKPPITAFSEEKYYSIIDVSENLSSRIAGQRDFGKHLVEAIKFFKRNPGGRPVYVEPYGQSLAVINTFSSTDTGICILEGGESYLVGKEATPSWAKAAKPVYSSQREVLELTLALKQGVYVNLFSDTMRRLINGCF